MLLLRLFAVFRKKFLNALRAPRCIRTWSINLWQLHVQQTFVHTELAAVMHKMAEMLPGRLASWQCHEYGFTMLE